MRDFFQSCTTLAFSLSLLGFDLIDDFSSMESREFRGSATRAVDAVSQAALDQLGPRLRLTFDSLNEIQRGVVGIMFDLSLAMAKATVNRLGDGTHAADAPIGIPGETEPRHRYRRQGRHGKRHNVDERDIEEGVGLSGEYDAVDVR